MSVLSPEQELRRLIERFEENPQGRGFAPLADAYRKAGRFEEALRLCREGLALHPRYPSAYVILGKVHLERGESQQARAAFEQVLAIDPQNLLALRHLALHAEQEGDQARALRCWEQLAAADPEAEDARERLAASGAEPRATTDVSELVTEDGPAAPETKAVLLTAMSDALEPAEDAPAPPAPSAPPTPESAPATVTAPAPVATAPVAILSAEDRSRAATEIATITLADIYAEQGFRAKALEIYRSVHARAPHRAPELSEKIARIEAEIQTLEAAEERLQSNVQHAVLADLERPAPHASRGSAPGTPAGARRTAPGLPAASPSDTPPGAASPAPSGDDGQDEPENFDHFQSWLQKMKLRNP